MMVAILLALAWGGLAFGAVYPWASEPLMLSCGLIGLVLLLTRRPGGPPADGRGVAIALAALCGAVVLQLVPVSPSVIRQVSPATETVLRQYDVAYATSFAAGIDIPRPFSIDPSRTRVGLFALVALGLLFVGAARTLTRQDMRSLVRGLLMLGVVMALTGIVQGPPQPRKIYGFWEPQQRNNSFGPFVNRNHFAGWMLMVVPLGLGYLCGVVERSTRDVRPDWRSRVLWWASKEANEAILVALAVLLMALSLVMTLSRSGIACFMLTLAVVAWFVAQRFGAGARRVTAMVYLIAVAIGALGWSGIGPIADRFAGEPVLAFGGRLGAWRDALRVAARFPITGTGLNTYSPSMLFYQTISPQWHYAQAHNDYLQLMAEGGLLVTIPAVLTVAAVAAAIRRRFAAGADDALTFWVRTGAVAALMAIGLQEMVDFSLQMPGNAALFAVVSAIAVLHPVRTPSARRGARPA